MRTAAKVLAFSGVFGLVVSLAYWIVTYEPAGTTLLAFMGTAALVVAAYLLRTGSLDLPEDRAEPSVDEPSDQTMAAFPRGSPWPAGIAVGAILLGGGFVFGPWLLAVSGAVLLATLIGFVRESRS